MAEWPIEPLSNTILASALSEAVTESVGGAGVTLYLEFSEEMDPAFNVNVNLKYGGVSHPVSLGGQWHDGHKIYSIPIPPETFPSNESESVTLSIGGVKDLAGNFLDSNPRTIAYHDDTGSWQIISTLRRIVL